MIRELQKAQRQTKKSAGRMQRDMKRAFSNIGRAAAGFGVAMAAATKVSVDFADTIGKTAKATGLTAEKFQELGFAAKRAGIESSLFNSSMIAFVKRVGEAGAGMGPLVSGLKNLNPELLQAIINAKDQSTALAILADGVKNASSATEQAAIANAAFGRSGVVMVNMLRDGSDGLDDMSAKARSLGVVMSNELVGKAEEAADAMGDLQKVMQVSIASAIIENADAIIDLTQALIDLVGAAGKATAWWRNFAEGVAAGIGGIAIDDWDRRAQEILDLEDQLATARKRSVNLFGMENRMWQARAASLEEEIRLKREALTADLQNIGTMRPAPEGDAPAGSAATSGRTFGAATAQAIELAKKHADELRERNRLEAEYATIRAEFSRDTATAAFQENAEFINDELDRRNELEREYQALLDLSKTALDLHKEDLDLIHLLYKEGIIPSVEEYAIALQAANERFAKTQEKTGEVLDGMSEFAIQASRNIQSQFADFLFDPFDEGLEGMLKGFGETLRRMAAEALAANIMESIMGSFGGGGGEGFGAFFASLFGGGKAAGGPVSAGVPYLVGERGPEMIVPRTASTVIPNHELGGRAIVNNFNFQKDPRRKALSQEAAEINRLQRRAEARNT
jgi:hypothetical protein